MVKLTLLARVADGLPLAEGLDGSPELDFYKTQAKTLFKKMSHAIGGAQYPSRMSYESGPMVFHYIVEHGVCYLTVTDRAYPKKLAYQYLSELQHQFDAEYRSQVRPPRRARARVARARERAPSVPEAVRPERAPHCRRTARAPAPPRCRWTRCRARTRSCASTRRSSARRSCTWTRGRSGTSTSSTRT